MTASEISSLLAAMERLEAKLVAMRDTLTGATS